MPTASAFVTLLRFKSKEDSRRSRRRPSLQNTVKAALARRGSSKNMVLPLGSSKPLQECSPARENCWQQTVVRHKYESNSVQILVALLIFANFIVSAVEAQLLPGAGTPLESAFLVFEWFFGLIFTAELVWNMYGSWWGAFWASGWNWFDFVIVVISLLSLTPVELPGISVLRLFRAFRVFRLFKRVPSLRIIIEGVVASLPGVFNAFIVVVLLMGIWSIMGVEFYGDATPEYFGDFFKAMFTMWQVMTMDSWASGVGRELIFDNGMWMAGIFFVSFTFICGIIMTNVVVAILLEKYLEATNKSSNGDDTPDSGSASRGSSRSSTPDKHSTTASTRSTSSSGMSSAPSSRGASPSSITDLDSQVAAINSGVQQAAADITGAGVCAGAGADVVQCLQLVVQRLDQLTDDVRLIKEQQQPQPLGVGYGSPSILGSPTAAIVVSSPSREWENPAHVHMNIDKQPPYLIV